MILTSYEDLYDEVLVEIEKAYLQEIHGLNGMFEMAVQDAQSDLAEAANEILRLKDRGFTQTREFDELYKQQQNRHELESKGKDKETQRTTAELKAVKKQLAQAKKQTEKGQKESAATMKQSQDQLDAKDMELGMASGNHSKIEARAAAAEAEILTLKAQLQSAITEKEGFQDENSKLLAFRMNPQVEQDRLDKAVQNATAAKDEEMQGLQSQVEECESARVMDQHIIRELPRQKQRLRDEVYDLEMTQRAFKSRVKELESHERKEF